jgi:hypothetical protein
MAARLAERGVRTLVCEEHTQVGDPVHCTGVLSAESFSTFDLPNTATLNQLTSVRFLSPGGIPVDSTPSPLPGHRSPRLRSRWRIERSPRARNPPARACGARSRCGRRRASVGRDRACAWRSSPAARATNFGRFGLPTTYLQTAHAAAGVIGDVELHWSGCRARRVCVGSAASSSSCVGVMASRNIRSREPVCRVGDRWGTLPSAAAREDPAWRRQAHAASGCWRSATPAGLVKPTTGGGITTASSARRLSTRRKALAADRFDAQTAPPTSAWRGAAEEFNAGAARDRHVAGIGHRQLL